MSNERKDHRTKVQLLEANKALRRQLEVVKGGRQAVSSADAKRQQALQESEARFRAVFESSRDAIVIVNDEGVFTQANPVVQAVFGLPPERLLGRNLSDFLGEAIDFPPLWRDFLAAGSFRGELPLVDADGRMRYGEVYGAANILPGRHMAVIRDITERKAAEDATERMNQRLQVQASELEAHTEELRVREEELRVQREELQATNEALRESETRYRELVQNANSVILRWTRDGTVTFFNEYAQEFFGYSEREALGKHVDFLVPERESTGADLTGLIQDIVKRPEHYVNHVNENICRDGRRAWIAWTNRPILDENGQVTEILAIGTDITERKRTEDALRRSSQFPEENPNPVLRVTTDGTLVYINPPAREWLASLGWQGDGPLPAPVRELAADAGAQDQVVEQEISNPAGRLFWFAAVRPAGEDYVNLYGRDITVRRRAEEDLRRDQGLLDSIIRTTDVMLVLLDREFNFVWVNPAYAATCRMKPEEMVGKNHFALYPDPENEAIFRKVRDTGEGAFYKDKQFTFPDQPDRGVTYWDWSLTPTKDAAANVTGLVFTLRETTKSKQAEEALRETEDRYHRLFEDDLTGNFMSMPDGEILLCNPAFAKTFGFASVDDAVGTSMVDLYIDVADRRTLLERLRREKKIERLEVWRKRWDGEPIYIVENLVGLFDEQGELHEIKGYVFDDTERKHAEEALRRSEERLRLAQQGAHIGTFEWDLRTGVNRWTAELEAMYGLAPGGFAGTQQAWEQLIHPEDREETFRRVRRGFETGEPQQAEWRVVWPDGSVHWLAGRWQVFKDESGSPARMAGVNIDITERRHAEEALRETEDRYHRLFEDDLTGNFLCTPEGEILLCNPAFARVFGFSRTVDAVGTNIAESYIDPREQDTLLEKLKRQEKVERLEVWRKRRDGQPVYIVENVVGRFDDQGRLLEIKGYTFDDTDRKRAEEAMQELNMTLDSKVKQRTAELEHRAQQLQKLALELSEAEDQERGRLAEILHDDLQQVLAAAKFRLNLLRHRAKGDPIQQASAMQVDDLLKDAIAKSRNLSHELSPAVLHHGDFTETLEWLADQVRSKHGLVVHVDAFSKVEVRSDALRAFLYKAAQELLFNVVKHARTGEARIRVRRWGRCICLSVADRGRGFDPLQLKAAAGFGLFSLRERVELLGGRMKIKSAPGNGSTFHIVVPDQGPVGDTLLVNEEQRPESPSSILRPPAERRLRVLVADDHAIVREGLISLLAEEHGIQVVGEAANGREAVDLADRLRPDVVVMDVAMPLINGDEATRQIKMQLPDTRVIALSMYDEPDMVQRMRRAGAEAYILKTAPSENLLTAIRGPKPAE